METIARGSCLCGAVRFEARGPLRQVIACHCTQCRKASGHFTAATRCATADLTISGDGLRWYRSSDVAERGFCGVCGSSLFWRPLGGDTTSVSAGAIDGPTGLTLVAQIHVDAKGDYYDLPDVPVRRQGDPL